MSDSVFQRFGALQFPIPIDDVEAGLTSLDPARDILLELFAAAINYEFDSAWTIATRSLSGDHKLQNTRPVNDTLPCEPVIEVIRERKLSFPLLCLHRTGEATLTPWLLDEDVLTQQWHLHYVMGDFDIDGQRRILDICQAIPKLVACVVRDYGHRSYEDGANQLEAADLSSMRAVSYTGPGRAQFGDEGPIYWAARITLETTEVSEPLTDQIGPLGGIDGSVDVSGAGDSDTSFDFVQFSTDAPWQKP
jgi:hypothetical protein